MKLLTYHLQKEKGVPNMGNRTLSKLPIIVVAAFLYMIFSQMLAVSHSANRLFFFIEAVACAGFPMILMAIGSYLGKSSEVISKKEYTKCGLQSITRAFIILLILFVWNCLDRTIVISQVQDVWNVILYGEIEKSYWIIYVLAGVWILCPVLDRALSGLKVESVKPYIGFCFFITVVSEFLQMAHVLPGNFIYLFRFLGYLMYLLLGWYLEQKEWSRKEYHWWYGIGAISLLFIWLGSYYWNVGQEETRQLGMIEPVSFWAIGWSTASYISIRAFLKGKGEKGTIKNLAKMSFGAFLLAPVWRKMFLIFFPLGEFPTLGQFFICILIYLLSVLTCYLGYLLVQKWKTKKKTMEEGQRQPWIQIKWRIHPQANWKDMLIPGILLVVSWILYLANWKMLQESPLLKGPMVWTVLIGITGMAMVNIRFSTAIERVLKVLIAIGTPFLSFYMLELCAENEIVFSGEIAAMNQLAYVVVFAALYAIFNRITLASIMELILVTIIGAANHFVLAFRGSPIQPADIYAVQTAASVAGEYKFSLTASILVSILIIFLAILMFGQIKKEKWRWQCHLATILCAGIIIVGYTNFVQADKLVENGFVQDLWEQKEEYQKNGFLVSFIFNWNETRLEAPENYNREEQKKILEASENPAEITGDKKYPNIIAIMNESFTDMTELLPEGKMITDEEILPFIHGWNDNVIKGDLLVSVFGGGTACTELEFLTGQSMAFYPTGSVPYQQYIHKQTDSMASLLKTYGYQTVAMHPFKPAGWSRDKVYPRMGFDQFLSINELGNMKEMRQYTSDEGNYDKIIEAFENKGDNPLFLFNVTMQNHGGYVSDFEGFQVDREAPDYHNSDLNCYLTLIHQSDKALEQLISYFSQQEEPVIVCFFGDHWPKMGDDLYEAMFEGASELDKNLTMHSTSFYIWANYELDPEEAERLTEQRLTSANYLGKHVLKLAGIPLNGWFENLDQVEKKLPVLSGVGYMDETGEKHLKDKTLMDNETFQKYQDMQYYYFYDK